MNKNNKASTHTPSPISSLRKHLLPVLSLSLISSVALANDDPFGNDNLWELDPEELGKVRVTSIATGTETPIDKAAAVVTIITQEDIAAIGATDIDQVLETVPGLHVNHSDQAFASKYIFRGISSTYNAQTLLLINGIPVTDLMFGNRGNVWGGMPVHAIDTIEVVRGPGSALYGAEAFAGVINIKTKNAHNTTNKMGLTSGTEQTRGAWIETATTINTVDVALIVEHLETEGWDNTIDHDAQTNMDITFGTDASLAPGEVNTGVKRTDVRFEANGKQWTLRTGYQDRSKIETGAGIASALDPEGTFTSRRFNTDISYHFNNFNDKNFTLEARASYYHATQEPEDNIILFPSGAFGGAYPNGFIGNPGFKERQTRLGLTGLYTGFTKHRIHIGTGLFWGDLYEVSESKNFNSDFSPKADGVVNVDDNSAEVWMSEKKRNSRYLFLQDEWGFTENWALTAGIRFDEYSDFGRTTNPRLALVWATTDAITTKLLYGRAFRAPSLNELYVVNNPVYIGNDNLDPESIDTVEFSFSHQLTDSLRYNFNIFHYEINDLVLGIDDSTTADPRAVSQNDGKRKGHGVEFDISYKPTDSLTLLANYAYQKSEDTNMNTDVGDAPNQQLYGRVNWKAFSLWNISTQANWVGEQKRIPGDDRDPVDDYVTVDLTIRATGLMNRIDLSFSVKNLFDEEVTDPSPWASPVSIPGDFPMAGRSYIAETALYF